VASPAPAVLPVDAVLPEVLTALERSGTVVLQAPPGSGKTTRVPPALLGVPWLGDRTIVVLEPRRVAARAAARRMAAEIGEQPGGLVGYRVRDDRAVGRNTRIEVVTEGILTRMLQADPSLPRVGAVVFDEWHERSIIGDLGLALCLDARGALRPDLRLVVMSATLDAASVAALLGDARVVTATAAPHPVTTIWLGRPAGRVEAAVARAVGRGLAEHDGGLLAFLPGAREIRAVERLLTDDRSVAAAGADVVALHGGLPGAAQDEALRPAAAGRRKVVLATSIAETSVTIDGARVVVDSGLMRVPRFDPSSGMTRLVTLPVSRAGADQRQGRAARQAPGVCYRLWSEVDHAGLPRAAPPEILVADLAPLALELAEWGATDPSELRWIDPPPEGPFASARALLGELGALGRDGRITAHGRAMAGLGVHPRLGHLLLEAAQAEPAVPGSVHLAAQVAAILSEGDPLRGAGASDADLTSRLDAIRRGRAPRLATAAARFERRLGTPPPRATGGAGPAPADAGRLLALAYPDRVGHLRAGRTGHWLLRNGRGAWVADIDPLATSPWIVAADLDGDRRDARIWLGAPLDGADVEDLFGADMEVVDRSGWDARSGDVVDVRERRLGAVVVRSEPVRGGSPGPAGLVEGIRASGLDLLPWTPELRRLQARVAFARRVDGDTWADLGDAALLHDLGTWLAPWLEGRARRADLSSLPLHDALWTRVGWSRRADLDAVAPGHLTLPTGERRRLDYGPDGPPTMTARLQELFGSSETPTVARGRVSVVIQLTSPAGRPVQLTSDLRSFWATTYAQVRGELRARYPRHDWPEDPLSAPPTSRPRPRRR
jgi:ATP-dependent helicase HrpB